MLLIAGKTALHIPLGYVALGGFGFSFSLARLIRQPSIGVVFGTLMGLGLFVFTISMICLARHTGVSVKVRSPFRSRVLEASATEVDVGVRYGSRGGISYVVTLRDRNASAELMETWTKWGGARAERRIQRFLNQNLPPRDVG